jgi:hypothetical protein
MQADRSAGAARTAGSARGLGVCDVLRIELEPVQRADLELQLAARVAALERRDGVQVRGAGLERCGVRPGPAAGGADCELGEAEEELRLLARMRAGVPKCAGRPFVFVGPAGLVLELVGACLAAAVTSVHARLAAGDPGALSAAGWERELEAAAAWIATALDCRAVEDYSFEPGVDPVHAW